MHKTKILISSIILNLMFCLVAKAAPAKKIAFMIGGGGSSEPEKGPTIFDVGFTEAGSFFENNGYEVIALFGNDAGSVQVVKKALHGKNTRIGAFDQNNMTNEINSLLKRIDRGEIKADDQVVLYVNTHGAGKDPDYKTNTQFVTTAYGYAVNLDRFIPLVNKLKEKKIKLTFIDLACYSGLIMSLSDHSICLITSADKDHSGYTSFGVNLARSMKPRRSTEDAFLEARRLTLQGAPEISTASGRVTKEALNPYEREMIMEGASLREIEEKNKDCPSCRPILSPAQPLIEFLVKTGVITETLDEYALFYAALGRYSMLHKEIDLLKKHYADAFADGDKAVGHYPLGTYNLHDLVLLERRSAHLKKLWTLEAKNPELSEKNREQFKKQLKQLDDTLILIDKMRANKTYKKLKSYYEKEAEITNKILVQAGVISQKERQLFQAIYEEVESHSNAAGKSTVNACRDFKL